MRRGWSHLPRRSSGLTRLAFLIAALPSCDDGVRTPAAPSAMSSFSVSGQVREAGTNFPLVGARVEVVDGPHFGKSATTGSGGRYRLDGLSGAFTVRASLERYEEQAKPVTSSRDANVDFDLQRLTDRVVGRVSDTLTGEGLTGMRIEIPGVAGGTSGSGGDFSLAFDQTGHLPLVLEGPGYWRRETQIRVEPVAEVSPDLLPKGGGFDLVFFDHVFRDKGRAGTRRWAEQPLVEIWTQEYTCLSQSQDGFCTEFEATDQRAAPPFQDEATAVIAADSPQYTGGFVSGSTITTQTHPPGTRITQAQYLVTGKITVALVATPSRSSWAWWRFTSGTRRMLAGHMQMNKDHRAERGTYSHELGHVLGFDHPDGHRAVPGRSIMRDDDYGPTQNDKLHGRVLYQRSPGSRTPDKDPEGFVLNGLGGWLLMEIPAEEEITVVQR